MYALIRKGLALFDYFLVPKSIFWPFFGLPFFVSLVMVLVNDLLLDFCVV
jgi:hypothetical protein